MEHIKTVVCLNCGSMSAIVLVCTCKDCELTQVDLIVVGNRNQIIEPINKAIEEQGK